MGSYNFSFSNLVLSLLVTALAYMIVPIVLRLTRNVAYNKKEANKISIINSVVIAIVFFVFREMSGDIENNAISVVPAFLYYGINLSLLQWNLKSRNYTYLFMILSLISCICSWFVSALLFGFIGFILAFGGLRLSRRKGSWQRIVLYIETFLGLFIFFCYLHSITLNIGILYIWGFIYTLICMAILYLTVFKKQVITDDCDDAKYNEEKIKIYKTLYCKLCGGELDVNNKCKSCGKQYFKFNKTLLFYVIIGVLVLSNIITVSMYVYKNNQLEDVIYECNQNTSLCETQLNLIKGEHTAFYIQEKLRMFDENIVFVIEGYGNYYYTYDCVQKITYGKEYSYWAYNRAAAIGKGYKQGTCY